MVTDKMLLIGILLLAGAFALVYWGPILLSMLVTAPSVVVISVLFGFVFGFEFLRGIVLFVEPSVEAAPPGHWTISQRRLEDGVSIAGLAHSYSLIDEQHLNSVIGWIGNALDRPRPNKPKLCAEAHLRGQCVCMTR